MRDDVLICMVCGEEDYVECFDKAGACNGCVFCNNCGTEIDLQTGQPSGLCGKCFGCRCLKDDGEFEQESAARR